MLRRNWRSFFILLTLFSDILAIFFAFLGGLYFRDYFPGAAKINVPVFIRLTLYFGVVFVLLSFMFGSYRAIFRSNVRRQFLFAGKAYVWAMLIVFALYDVLHLGVFPRRFAVAFVVLLPVFFIALRLMLNKVNLWLQGKGFGIHHALVAGDNGWTQEVVERFLGFPELGYAVKGVVVVENLPHLHPKTAEQAPDKQRKASFGKKITFGSMHSIPTFTVSEISTVFENDGIDRVFVSSESLAVNGFDRLTKVCREHRVKLNVLSPLSDNLLRTARIPDIIGITLYSPPRTRIEFLQRKIKRGFDMAAACVLIVLCSPLLLAASAAILVESGFPVIFKHLRSSTKGGREFYFYKFRSMVKDADERKESLFQFNEADGALFKMKNDPRLTRVGKFIRKYSIDELPQLFNVLKGDMSLVGPRPLPPSDFAKVKGSPEFWSRIQERAKVKPGMTGLWQISGRSYIGFQEMVLLDLYYVENQSLLFDMEILLETIPVVLFGKGAY